MKELQILNCYQKNLAGSFMGSHVQSQTKINKISCTAGLRKYLRENFIFVLKFLVCALQKSDLNLNVFWDGVPVVW
jgi:hypothetical protein